MSCHCQSVHRQSTLTFLRQKYIQPMAELYTCIKINCKLQCDITSKWNCQRYYDPTMHLGNGHNCHAHHYMSTSSVLTVIISNMIFPRHIYIWINFQDEFCNNLRQLNVFIEAIQKNMGGKLKSLLFRISFDTCLTKITVCQHILYTARNGRVHFNSYFLLSQYYIHKLFRELQYWR